MLPGLVSSSKLFLSDVHNKKKKIIFGDVSVVLRGPLLNSRRHECGIN